MGWLRAAEADPRGWVRPEALNVAPQLVGLALARPWHRLAAMGVDLAVVGLLAGVSGFWLFAGLVLVVLQLRQRGAATTRPRLVVGWMGVGLIVLLVLHEGQSRWDELQNPPAHKPAVANDEVKAAAREIADEIRAEVAEGRSELSGAASAAERVASAAMKVASAATGDAQRIAVLEAELAKAREPKPTGWRAALKALVDAFGDAYGWGVVYFSLLPAWWGGQTVGKKLFGLQVVELTGKPMTVMRGLKRYGGYAAGMATGGLGFVQLLWDDNRQAIQDKTAHTVVLDLRAPPRSPADAALSPPEPPRIASSTSSSR